MAKIEFKQDGVGHFIADNFLKVPIYQRSFAWETLNVQDMVEDIKNSYLEDYFIGTIVVTDKREGDYLEIVDGQQRLATINMFFAAVRDLLKELGNNDKSTHIETEYLWKESLRDEDRKQKLTLNNMDNDFYFRRIIGSENDTEPTKESHNRILGAYNCLKSFVKNKYENETINGIFDLVEFIETSENTHKTFYRRLGNLTILDTKMNSDVSAGSFSFKINVYKKSEIEITKELSKHTIWTPQEIEKRQKEFAEKAVKIWGINIR